MIQESGSAHCIRALSGSPQRSSHQLLLDYTGNGEHSRRGHGHVLATREGERLVQLCFGSYWSPMSSGSGASYGFYFVSLDLSELLPFRQVLRFHRTGNQVCQYLAASSL